MTTEASTDRTTKIRLAVIVGGALLLALIGGAIFLRGDSRPGDPEVYERIEASTDCTDLYVETIGASLRLVDEADKPSPDRDKLKAYDGYHDAAEERMESLGCDGEPADYLRDLGDD